VSEPPTVQWRAPAAVGEGVAARSVGGGNTEEGEEEEEEGSSPQRDWQRQGPPLPTRMPSTPSTPLHVVGDPGTGGGRGRGGRRASVPVNTADGLRQSSAGNAGTLSAGRSSTQSLRMGAGSDNVLSWDFRHASRADALVSEGVYSCWLFGWGG
jgi:hypothetical protein